MAERYLELLSEYDLRVLAQLNGWLDETASDASIRLALQRFRDRPMLISEMLETPGLHDQLLAMDLPTTEGVAVEPSELLSFAILVHERCATLTRTGFVASRIGGRIFVPYLLDHDILSFAGQPEHRLFLVELLGSFTGRRLASGLLPSDATPATTAVEFDAVSLVRLLQRVTEEEKIGLYRRLGDLALFRSGMFAAETAARHTNEADVAELLRSLPDRFQRDDLFPALASSLGAQSDLQLFAELGPIWYRMAARRSPWPSISAPLISIADNFDAASQLLQQLAATSSVRDRRSLLFPSAV